MTWYEEDEGSLYNYLMEHKDEIFFVNLEWTWPYYARLNTPFYYNEPKTGNKVWLYAEFTGERIDTEYSFVGTFEEAVEFSKKYDCWGRCMFEGEEGGLNQGVLEVHHHAYDNEAEEYPDDEISPEAIDLYFVGLVYHSSYGGYPLYGGEYKRWRKDE